MQENNNLTTGLGLLLPTWCLQSAALLASARGNIFIATAVMTATGTAFGCLSLCMREQVPLLRATPRMHLIGVAIAVSNIGNVYLTIPAVVMLGIGPVSTIKALGGILVSAKTKFIWTVLAVSGVALVNEPWLIFQGHHGDLAMGTVLALLAGLSDFIYIKLGYDETPEPQRTKAVQLGLFYTVIFAGLIGTVGHAGFGLGEVPTWQQTVLMPLIGLFVWAVPGVVQGYTARMIPGAISGFIFTLRVATAAVTGAVAATLGLVSDKQAPTLLGWTGVATILVMAACITRADNHREHPKVQAAVRDRVPASRGHR